jgi:hypothetical protein
MTDGKLPLPKSWAVGGFLAICGMMALSQKRNQTVALA